MIEARARALQPIERGRLSAVAQYRVDFGVGPESNDRRLRCDGLKVGASCQRPRDDGLHGYKTDQENKGGRHQAG